MQVLDMGETHLDEDTFDEYLIEIRDNYTPEKVRFYSQRRQVQALTRTLVSPARYTRNRSSLAVALRFPSRFQL